MPARSAQQAVTYPTPEEMSLVGVLHALSDATRMVIVASLLESAERPCGTFPVTVSPSTLTYHFKVLREAGLIHQREEGRRKLTSLRRDEVEARFPGLLDTIISTYQREPAST